MQIENYLAFMETYTGFLEEMAGGEDEKYAALLSYDAKRAERAVTRQQAMNMRLKQMEERREQEQKAAGLEGLTFRQILEKLDPQEREALSGVFRRFERAVEQVKYFNGKSAAFAREGLRLTGAAGDGGPGAYGADGKRPDKGPGVPLFETEV